jgi:cyclophilin family peptidyl-prolyl cis-trans isomerase
MPEAGVDYLNGKPNPTAHIISEKGEFWIELFADMAPFHVKNFIELAESGVYDRLKFHRVVPNFVVQGLDPRGDGWGRNNLTLRDEINQVKFLRGYVGMPNSGPDTGGCQIFITQCCTPHLDGKYTAFGKVISGMNVVDALQVGDRILRITIER